MAMKRSLAKLTDPNAVRSAMKEYDRVGAAAFLAKQGYRPARTYFVMQGRKRYDSKAIAGVAFGYQHPRSGALAYNEFSGGEQTVWRKLTSLGFDMEPAFKPPRDLTRPTADPSELDERVRRLRAGARSILLCSTATRVLTFCGGPTSRWGSTGGVFRAPRAQSVRTGWARCSARRARAMSGSSRRRARCARCGRSSAGTSGAHVSAGRSCSISSKRSQRRQVASAPSV